MGQKKQTKSIEGLLRSQRTAANFNDLSTDTQLLTEFLILIVNIKYRNRYKNADNKGLSK